MKKKYALVVHDQLIVQKTISQVLTKFGFESILASNSTEAKLKITNQDFDLMVLDMVLSNFDSHSFVMRLRNKEEKKHVNNRTPIFIIGADASLFQKNFKDIDLTFFVCSDNLPTELPKKIETMQLPNSKRTERSQSIKKGEVLISEGSKSTNMFWVLEGEFVISKECRSGNSVILGRIGAGQLVGDMSFLDCLPRSATVVASIDSEVLEVPNKKFLELIESQPRWFKILMSTLTHRLRDSNTKIAQRDELDI